MNMVDIITNRLQEGSNCTFMELKYIGSTIAGGYQASSNCTFMELKLRREHTTNQRTNVLIVPLWN